MGWQIPRTSDLSTGDLLLNYSLLYLPLIRLVGKFPKVKQIKQWKLANQN